MIANRMMSAFVRITDLSQTSRHVRKVPAALPSGRELRARDDPNVGCRRINPFALHAPVANFDMVASPSEQRHHSASFVAQMKASQAAPSFLALRLQSWFEDCLAVLVMAAHSAPRRPPRYSGRASRRRRTAYHCFGLRDDRAGLPDGRRDVYGEA